MSTIANESNRMKLFPVWQLTPLQRRSATVGVRLSSIGAQVSGAMHACRLLADHFANTDNCSHILASLILNHFCVCAAPYPTS